MNYNIDSKENFDIIILQTDIFNLDLADNLHIFIKKNYENNRSVIIDFSSINSIEGHSFQQVEQWHHELYDHNLSFVMCSFNESVKIIVTQTEFYDILNITPKVIEAIDIVSMENLERELMNGEDLDF